MIMGPQAKSALVKDGEDNRYNVVSEPDAILWVASVELTPNEVENLTIDIHLPDLEEEKSSTENQ
jgi:hypothetical protein